MSARRLLVAAAAGAALATTPAVAADPSSGTVSSASPTVSWAGTITGGLVANEYALLNGLLFGDDSFGDTCGTTPICDTFALTLHEAGDLSVTADAPDATGFTMIEIIKPDGSTEFAEGDADHTQTTLKVKKAPAGEYEVRLTSDTIQEVDYSASATLILPAPPAAAVTAPPAAPPAAQAAPAPAPAATASPAKLAVLTRSASARRLLVRLRTDHPVTRVDARLLKGRWTVARGKLATLDATGSLRLKGSRRALLPGAYKLVVTAQDASTGGTITAAARLRVRR